MATLEKLKYYYHLLFRYISRRFGILKFSGFAVLLCLLGTTDIPDGKIFAENFIFVFASLFSFRLLDDAWSFHLDRIYHPQRTYLLPGNFKSFIVFTVLVFIIYLIGLFLFSRYLAITILILSTVSIGLYFLFYKVKSIMIIIPLLKYPVLIWCISRFSLSSEILYLSAGALLMMLTSDFIDENPPISYRYMIRIVLILITGLLVFQPWDSSSNLLFDIVFVSIPVLLIAFSAMREEPKSPVIIFPILHISDLLFSL